MMLCLAPAGTMMATPSETWYSISSMMHFPCPDSKRKNWSLSGWVSMPISSLGWRCMRTSWLWCPV